MTDIIAAYMCSDGTYLEVRAQSDEYGWIIDDSVEVTTEDGHTPEAGYLEEFKQVDLSQLDWDEIHDGYFAD